MPKFLILGKSAHITQPLRHNPAGCRRDVNSNPLALQILRRNKGRTATTESIEHDVVLVAARVNDSFKQWKWFLCRIAHILFCLCVDWVDLVPHTPDPNP